MRILLFICLVFFLTACETEKERFNRLNAQLNDLRKQEELAQRRFSLLMDEQKKCWASNAKERFAYLDSFQEDQELDLEHQGYAKSILFKKVKKDKYTVIVKIRTRQDIKPEFYIYLYDRSGLIVGFFHQKKKFIGGKITKNQTVEKQGQIEVSGIPYYYRIEVL